MCTQGRRRAVRRGAPPAIWAVAAVLAGIEAVLTLSDMGLLPLGMRAFAYDHFAFYAVVVHAVQSGQTLPASLYATFVTHAFLHGGMLHVMMNGAIFLALGAHLSRAVGAAATLMLFLGTVVGGAIAFGLLAPQAQQFVPMVGASGGVFGLLGAMKRWEWRHLVRNRLPRRRFWTTVAVFAGVNVVLSLGAGLGGGGIAWEAHLGGFVVGWLAAGFLTPRPGTEIGPI